MACILTAQYTCHKFVCCFVCCLVTKSCPTLAIPRTVALQAPLSMEFPWQEHLNGLPFPTPGIKHTTPVSLDFAGGFFTVEPSKKQKS